MICPLPRTFFMMRLFALLAALVAGCGTMAPQSKYAWAPSPNFNERRPNYIVIHQTDSVSNDSALATLRNPLKEVSAHYLISAEGHITQLVDEKFRAWHAGQSWWGGQTDMNSASIGIELDNMGDTPFAPAQIDALLTLLNDIKERYRIPAANYLAHGDIAPGRKVDPNYLFPWQKLAERGFGLWCNAAEISAHQPVADPLAGLQMFGYDTNNPEAAQRAFRRHFRGNDSNAEWNTEDLAALNCLLEKRKAPE